MKDDDLAAIRAELRGLRELAGERDKWYDRWFTANKEAVAAAVVAAKEQVAATKELTAASFRSSEQAAGKFEEALKEYKAGANEWRETVKDLIGNLRESRSRREGGDTQHSAGVSQAQWVVTTVLAAFAFAASIMHFFR